MAYSFIKAVPNTTLQSGSCASYQSPLVTSLPSQQHCLSVLYICHCVCLNKQIFVLYWVPPSHSLEQSGESLYSSLLSEAESKYLTTDLFSILSAAIAQA